MSKSSNVHLHPAAFGQEASAGKDGSRPSIARPGAPMPAASDSIFDVRISEELHTLNRWIEQVVYNVSSDPILAHRHSGDIQALKRVGDLATQLASVVAVADKAGAIDRLSASELKARLQRKPIQGLFEAKH